MNTLTGIAGILTLEYERATTSRATWGATVMFGGLEEERYRAARALYRFYPFEAFRGPFVGLQAGIASWANPTTDRGPHSELGADVGVTFPT